MERPLVPILNSQVNKKKRELIFLNTLLYPKTEKLQLLPLAVLQRVAIGDAFHKCFAISTIRHVFESVHVER